MSFSISTQMPRKPERTKEKQQYKKDLKYKRVSVYLGCIKFFNFRPDRIKVSTDEVGQKAERKSTKSTN